MADPVRGGKPHRGERREQPPADAGVLRPPERIVDESDMADMDPGSPEGKERAQKNIKKLETIRDVNKDDAPGFGISLGGKNYLEQARNYVAFRSAKLDRPELRDMMVRDWGSNNTANYSKINLVEVMLASNFDFDFVIDHWRFAKVLDGIVLCANELQICSNSISPDEITKKIYSVFQRKGGPNEKIWAIDKLVDPVTGKVVTGVKASLSDFAEFVDVYEANKSLDRKSRLGVKELAFKYFTGGDLTTEEDYEENDKDGKIKKGKKNIDLLNYAFRDDFADLSGEKFKNEYIDKIKAYRIGFQVMTSFRGNSNKHRENSCHAYLTELTKHETGRSEFAYILLSGRMAAELSGSDLRKGEGGSGVDGHIHEVSEINENFGVIVRIRARDLDTQRRDVDNSNKFGKTSPRFYNMAMGLDSEGNGAVREEKKGKKIIYLNGRLGQDEKTVDSMAVRAIKDHYNKYREYVGLKGLSDKQAADVFITDVVAPYFLQNPKDWLMCFAKTFGVSGRKRPGNVTQTILNCDEEDEWQDFELRMVGLDLHDGVIKELPPFTRVKELKDYILRRKEAGHVDQEFKVNYEKLTRDDKADKSKHLDPEKLTDEKIKSWSEFLNDRLKNEYRAIMSKYAEQGELGKDFEVDTGVVVPDIAQKGTYLFTILLKHLLEFDDQDVQYFLVNEVGVVDDPQGGEPADWQTEVDNFVEGLLRVPIEVRKKMLKSGTKRR